MNKELLETVIRDRYDTEITRVLLAQLTEMAQLIELSQELELSRQFITELICDFKGYAEDNEFARDYEHYL